MKFNEYIKKSRERNNLTQEVAAELLGVSIQSIQNWEKDTLPDKNYWDIIINTYKLNKDEFSKKYINSVLPENIDDKENDFPYFLYPEKFLPEIMKLVLTEDEQELLGLLTIYSGSFDMPEKKSNYHFEIYPNSTLAFLPYEYVRRVGSFNVLSLQRNLDEKLGNYKNFVINRIIENPNVLFDISKLNYKQYWILCDYILMKEERCRYDYITNKTTLLDVYKKIIELLIKIDNNEGLCVISKIKDGRDGTYESDWDTINDGSIFIDAMNDEFVRQYLKVVIEECSDQVYIDTWNKYNEDLKFYNDHQSMMDHAPRKPKYIAQKCIIMSDEGLKLFNFYKKYIE